MTTNTDEEAIAALEALLAQVDGQHRRLLDVALLGFQTVAETARELKVTRQRVRDLAVEGKLESVKVGDSLLIERASVERFKRTRRPAGRPRKDQR